MKLLPVKGVTLFYQKYFLTSDLLSLIALELCLLRYEAISIPNIIIRQSSSGLFAAGVKEIRRMYCAGSFEIYLSKIIQPSVRDCNGNPSDKKIEVESPTKGNGIIV